MAKHVEVTIEDELKKVISEHLGVEIERVTKHADFVMDLGADSLDIVELRYGVEEHFHIEIPYDLWDRDGDNLKGVKKIVKELLSEPGVENRWQAAEHE